jgi:hypothetical protein
MAKRRTGNVSLRSIKEHREIMSVLELAAKIIRSLYLRHRGYLIKDERANYPEGFMGKSGPSRITQ